MSSFSRPRLLGLTLGIALGLCAGPVQGAEGQTFPGFGGVEGRIGPSIPVDAGVGLGAGMDVDLGYVRFPFLRPVAGFNHFRSSVDRVARDGFPVTGTLTASEWRGGLRVDPLGHALVAPYFLAIASFHRVRADVDDPETERHLGGSYLGGGVGAGIALSLDPDRRVSLTTELRRVFAPRVGHVAVEAGIRLVPLGTRAYERGRVAAVAEGDTVLIEDPLADPAPIIEEMPTVAANEALRRQAELAREEREAARAEALEAEARALEAERRRLRALGDLNRLIDDVVEIRESERGLAVVLGSGLFATGEHELTPRARDQLRRIAAVVRLFDEHAISVEGHTDSVGAEALNLRLSERRAAAVRDALVEEGLDPARMEVVGHGEHLPLDTNQTPEGRAQNRRVEIVILGARRLP